MAKVVPSGVIQLPDFAQLDYNLKQQKKKEDLETAKYLSQYQQLGGNILDADRELIQGLYNQVEDSWDAVAANPTDTTAILNLNKAYNQYSRAHGTAMAVADHWKKINSDYNQDPTKYNLSSGDFSSLSNDIRLNKRDSLEGLESYYSNLTELPIARARDFGSAEQFAEFNINAWDKTFKGLDIDGDGKVDDDQRDNWFDSIFQSQILRNEDSRRNAILSEAKRQNAEWLEQPELTSEQINYVLSNESLSEKYLNDYYDRSKGLIKNQTSLVYVDPATSKYRSQQLYLQNLKMQQDKIGQTRPYLTPQNQGMVPLPVPVKIGAEQIYQYGEGPDGKKYAMISSKDELGRETSQIKEVSPEKFESIAALINEEYKSDPSFFMRNLFNAIALIPKPTSVAGAAEEPANKSANQIAIENQTNQRIVDSMVGLVARDPEATRQTASELANKYPDAAERSGMNKALAGDAELTADLVNSFAAEIDASAKGLVASAKAVEKEERIAVAGARELEEYKALSTEVGDVGRELGVNRNVGESSDEYFKRIQNKVREINSDTYLSQGSIRSSTNNENNIKLRRKLNRIKSSYDKTYKLYADYLDAVKDLEEQSR